MGYEWPQLIQAGDFTMSPGTVLGFRVIHEYELVYFPKASSGCYIVEEELVFLDRPCIILTQPGRRHQYRFATEATTRHQFIHFEPGQSINELLVGMKWPHCISLQGPSLVPHLLNEIMGIVAEKKNHWAMQCSAMLYLILSYLLTNESANDRQLTVPVQLQQAQWYIEKHIGQSLRIVDIARTVGWSHEHLTRSFQQFLGMSPRAFIVHRRIERACQLLTSGTLSIKEIAYEVGFSDEHYFSRCFRLYKGMTASRYREKFADLRILYTANPEIWQTHHPLNTYFVT